MLPEFVYIAREPLCNCVFGVVTDYQDADTGYAVASFITSGGIIQRHNWAEYQQISEEETFLNCPHGQMKMNLEEM